MARINKILMTAAAGLALAGCASSVLPPAWQGLASMDWFIGPAPGAAAAANPVPVRYCYDSLGRIECHHQPLAGEDGRLIGFAGPAPAGYQP